jgi:hypothetical protein
MTPLLLLVGCGGETKGPVDSGSIAVAINSMNQSDIRTPGVIRKDENLSTMTGNPWGEFIKRAKMECGKDPMGFGVTSVSISLDTSGSGGDRVARFEDVVNGQATVLFSSTQGSDDAAARVDIASVASPTGPGPVTLATTATRQSFAPILPRMVGGDFHVGLRAATSKMSGDKFSMDVRVYLAAKAFCE